MPYSIITITWIDLIMESKKLTAGEVRVILNRLFCVMMCESQMVAGLNDVKLMTFSDLAVDGAKLEKSYKRCVDNFGNLRGWHIKHDKDSIRLRSEFINRLAKLV